MPQLREVREVTFNGEDFAFYWPATTSDLGSIKVGDNLNITSDGTLSGNYSDVTDTDSGLMSAADKVKLDNIETSSDTSVIDFIKPIKVTEIQLPSGIIIS